MCIGPELCMCARGDAAMVDGQQRELVYEYFILSLRFHMFLLCVWNLVSNDARNARPYLRAIWTWRTRAACPVSLSLRTESVWRGKPHSPPVTLYSALDARARVVVAEALDGRRPDC